MHINQKDKPPALMHLILGMMDTNIIGVADEGPMFSLLFDRWQTVGSFVKMIHRARAHRGGNMATAWQWDE